MRAILVGLLLLGGALPRVSATCGYPSLPEKGGSFIFVGVPLNSNGSYPVGTSARVLCDPGYLPIPFESICQKDGTWSPVQRCVVYCTRPAPPENGLYNPVTGYEFRILVGGNVTFRCRSGYRLVGSARIICQEDGTWNASTPVCEDTAVSCSDPTPANGHITVNQYEKPPSNGLFYKYTHILVSCNPGYTLFNPVFPNFNSIVCLPTGTWVPVIPTCVLQRA